MDAKYLNVYKSYKVETWVRVVVNTKQTISTTLLNVIYSSKYYIIVVYHLLGLTSSYSTLSFMNSFL